MRANEVPMERHEYRCGEDTALDRGCPYFKDGPHYHEKADDAWEPEGRVRRAADGRVLNAGR